MAEVLSTVKPEETAPDSNLVFMNIADAVPVLIWISNAEGACFHFNKRWLNFTGRTLQQERNSGWQEGIHPNDRTNYLRSVRKSIDSREEFKAEFRLRRFDGQYRFMLEHGVPQYSSNGKFRGFIGSCTDITDEKLISQSLEQQLKDYELIFNSAPGIIIYKDTQNNVLRINRTGAELFGKTREEIEGRNARDLLPVHEKATVDRYYEQDLQVMRSGQPLYNIIDCSPASSGKLIWTLIDKIPHWGPDGSIDGVVVFGRDITDRHHAEEALIQSERRYKAIVEDQSELVCRYRSDGLVTFTNDAFYRFFKEAREEMVGGNRRPLIPDELLKFSLASLKNSEQLNSGTLTFVHSLFLKNNAVCWLQWTIRALLDEQGQFAEFQAVGRDITALKTTEEKLRSYLVAMETSVDGIAICDENGKFIFMNEAHAKMFEAPSPESFIGKSWQTLYDEKELILWKNRFEEFMYLGRWRGEAVGMRFDQTTFAQEVSLTALPSGEVVCVCRDISARKENEERLKKTASDLARSNRELEQFAYIASHDLQEPLRMVSSFVDLLVEENQGKLNEESQKCIHFAQEGVIRMRTLIRDLLEYSRIGRSFLEESSVDCDEVLSAAKQNLTKLIESSGAKITSDKLPIIRGNSTTLLQVFQNIIENAIKYGGTDSPEIQIKVQKNIGKNIDKVTEEWLFSIADNGIGFNQIHSERIFQIFQRLQRRQPGSGNGIGLAIAKKIIESYGGRIWAESVEGRGSIFSFTIPISHDKKIRVST
ncbi:MAG: multi-sensor signal transduction histidine kinase [Bacteriovoracaceae bacterium]|nr:multi-sensor signal transduction histidine kinase [Bacteriovoracaceae bacterium]